MNSLLQVGIVLTAMDKMSGVINGATSKAAQGFDKLQHKIAEVSAKMTEMGTKASLMGHGIITALQTPITAFADLDEASTNLRVAMMDNLGRIPPQFAEINKQAVELGNVLPGTTADFVNSARALIENGTALETIVGGGLKAASYLGVILQVPQAGAAEMVAKFRESFGLMENELVTMADLTQRAKFAFGLNPEEIKYAAQYAGATLNNLHLTGIENTKRYLAMQGIARQKGMEGSVFGTNFASMLNNIGQMEQKLHRNSKIMREVNADLRHAGIHLKFFDSAGKFVGLEKMVAELEKLKVLSEHEKLNVMNKLFGMEGGRVGSMLSDAGVAGLHKAMATMDRQADLTKRIEAISKSAKNTWEALTGTITNFWAAMGGPMVTALYPLINKVNEFVGGPMMEWASKNQELVKWLGLGALAVGGLLVALGGLGIVAGAVASGLAIVCGILGAVFAVSLPVVMVIGLIAAAATWIVSNWSHVKAFFKGFWLGFLVGIKPIMPLIRKIGQVLSWLGGKIKVVWNWFKRLVGPIGQSTGKTASFGVTVGKVFGAIISKVVQFYSIFFKVISMPVRIVAAFVVAAAQMYKAGGSFIDMLWAGMKAAAGKLYDGVKEIAAKVRAFWPFSPAKEGPLRDLHRVKIIETIAEGVHAGPLVKAMGTAAAAGMLALAPLHKAQAATAPPHGLGRRVPIASVATPKSLTQGQATAHPAVAAKAIERMSDPRWQDPRLQAILRRNAGMTATAKPAPAAPKGVRHAAATAHPAVAAKIASPALPRGVGRRVPVAGAATPKSLVQAQAVATAHPAVAAKAVERLSDPRWQDPRLQAILRRNAGVAATAKPAPAAPRMPRPMPASKPANPMPRPVAASGAGRSGGAGGPGGRGGVTVNFSPTINVQGGGKDDIMAALKAHEHELVALIERVMARNARRNY